MGVATPYQALPEVWPRGGTLSGTLSMARAKRQPVTDDVPGLNPETGRLRVADVQRMHGVIGGDPVTEAMILRFIADQYGARSLLEMPAKVAAAILQRPVEFIRAAKRHCEPALNFSFNCFLE